MKSMGLATGVSFLASLGCGSGPTTPIPPTEPHFTLGTAFTFTSGEDGRAVSGASVLLSGTSTSGMFVQTYTTDAMGRFFLDRPVLHSPAPALDITGPGFLKRETLIRSPDERTFTLWPSTSPTGLDETFTAFIVYSASQCPARLDPGGPLRQLNPAKREATVVLEPSLGNSADIQRHQRVADELTSALGGAVRYAVATVAPANGVTFRVSLEPENSICLSGSVGGYFVREFEDSYISGGRIVYCSAVVATNLWSIAHELGHTTGLQHSPAIATGEVMSCTYTQSSGVYSPREALAMRLMLQRPTGNLWPDRDRPLSNTMALKATGASETIVCPRPAIR